MRIKIEHIYNELMLSTTINGVEERMLYVTHSEKDAVEDFKMYLEQHYGTIKFDDRHLRGYGVEKKDKYIADIGKDYNWVDYTDSNDGEPNYYRDVYSLETGQLIYSDGEVVTVVEYNELDGIVTLQNECLDETFTIPIKQFEIDFV